MKQSNPWQTPGNQPMEWYSSGSTYNNNTYYAPPPTAAASAYNNFEDEPPLLEGNQHILMPCHKWQTWALQQQLHAHLLLLADCVFGSCITFHIVWLQSWE